MLTEIKNVKVIGMAAAVSPEWDSIKEMADEDEVTIKRFIKKTGVSGRYSASPKQTTADFCYAAAEKLIAEKSIDKNQIGILIFVTQTSDYRIPATACVLQHRLDLSNECICFDINLGCSGFVYGLNIVSCLLANTGTKYGLLLAGDTSAREHSNLRKQKEGRSGTWLFGDSGTATLLEKEDGNSLRFLSNTDGRRYKAIISPYGGWRNPDSPDGRTHYAVMDDIAVFNFATEEAPNQLNEYMGMTGTTPENYDCLVLHQANLMIMKRVAKKTAFPEEKMLVSMNLFGNTSSASIPISLVDKYGDTEDPNKINALCCGFGVGLSWATVAFEIATSGILPLVHTDEYFKDGYNLDDQVK
ncbi:MAG TPA: ketoacyl-ACP synthase III [Clostridiaceae bacterium]|jgi:3-oxoacyl-[acyl-carrier-protein] synthase-3|nr:ketoacyl-ACP synthase III [Clostridiaceae bacterium]